MVGQIGQVDRSRNPNLEVVLLLGLNETVFPAAPPPPVYQQPAPPPPQAAAPAPSGATTDDKLAQLKQLGELRESGVLTDAEFEATKLKILGSF